MAVGSAEQVSDSESINRADNRSRHITGRDEPTLGFCFLFIASESHDRISARLIVCAISALSTKHVI
ncbi:Uncharacterized protein HZ326_25128 [Fusarium oxysporum f. sp. albedinis]|nr:Uncharacterized protein HZ326_25128 [Fusarium oxysporum f. sp. albedinis]